jgi:hypothetical protein
MRGGDSEMAPKKAVWYFVLARRRQVIQSITYTDYSSSIGQFPTIDPHRLSNVANSPNHSTTIGHARLSWLLLKSAPAPGGSPTPERAVSGPFWRCDSLRTFLPIPPYSYGSFSYSVQANFFESGAQPPVLPDPWPP